MHLRLYSESHHFRMRLRRLELEFFPPTSAISLSGSLLRHNIWGENNEGNTCEHSSRDPLWFAHVSLLVSTDGAFPAAPVSLCAYLPTFLLLSYSARFLNTSITQTLLSQFPTICKPWGVPQPAYLSKTHITSKAAGVSQGRQQTRNCSFSGHLMGDDTSSFLLLVENRHFCCFGC